MLFRSAGTARELLTEPEVDTPESGNLSDAAQMLTAELTPDSWTNADTACKPLKDAGFSKKQIWSASKKLDVVRKKGGMNEGWYWRLPSIREGSAVVQKAEDSAEDSEGSNFLNGESSESSGEMESSVEAVL